MTETSIPTSISIADDAFAVISFESRRSADGLETGGILLGIDGVEEIAIRYAGGPGPNAHRAPRRFLRDLNYAQQLAADAWTRDGSQWIGEWHTHPSGGLEPSDLDLDSYLRHLHDPDLRLDRFVAIIVALLPDEDPQAATWLVDRHSAQSLPLRRSHEPEDI